MKAYWLILCILMLTFCKKEEVSENKNGIVEESFLNIPILASSIDYSLEMEDGTNWEFRLTATEEIGDSPLPLIIALHHGGNEMAFQTYSDCLAKPAFIETPCVIFASSNSGLGWEHPTNETRISNFIDLAIKHWPIDSSRIVITGYSNGGIGTWKFASEFSDQISAAIPMGGYFQDPIKFDMPIYAIQGELDELFPPDELNETIIASQTLGSNITYVIAEGLSHYETCFYVPFLKSAAEWLQEEVW